MDDESSIVISWEHHFNYIGFCSMVKYYANLYFGKPPTVNEKQLFVWLSNNKRSMYNKNL